MLLLKTWGSQSINNDLGDISGVSKAPILPGLQYVEVGGYHLCAVVYRNKLNCGGSNRYGQTEVPKQLRLEKEKENNQNNQLRLVHTMLKQRFNNVSFIKSFYTNDDV